MTTGAKVCPKCSQLLRYSGNVVIIPAMVSPANTLTTNPPDPVNTKAGLPVEAWVCDGPTCRFVELYYVKV